MFYVYVLKLLSGFLGQGLACFGERSTGWLLWLWQHSLDLALLTKWTVFLQNAFGSPMLDVNQYWSPNLYNTKRGALRKV